MNRRGVILGGCAASLGLVASRLPAATRERVIGAPCEGCDWAYDDMPAKLAAVARIAPAGEPGAALILEGVVADGHGEPAAGVIVYAYHTDQTGIYPRARNRHGRLKGWAVTDVQGRYRFDTIRPGAYPGKNVPEHVHMHVIEPGVGTYYIDDVRFLDDPLLTERPLGGRGGSGLLMPARRDVVWHARRDVVLGRDIPGYPR